MVLEIFENTALLQGPLAGHILFTTLYREDFLRLD
jgi:hypothetical protein